MQVPFVDLKAQYQAIKEPINQQIQNVLEHGFFIMGPEVKKCEEDLAKYLGSKHALSCASGTDAAILAFLALGIGPGDEVITTAFSFIATAETIVLAGATPVYVDIDPETLNIDPSKIEEAITDKTKAIVPVSLYGQPADMDEINAIADKNNLIVIEDAAQSFGAPYKNKKSGNLSTVGITSFFPAKPLGCYGDGGAVFTDDENINKKLIEARNHGQSERYFHTSIGTNGRLDTLQCAILIEKLKRYPWEVEQRQRLASNYTHAFSKLECKTPIVKEDRDSVWAQYTLHVENRDEFREKLQADSIPTAVHYPITMPEQPAYKEIGRCHDIPNAKAASQKVVSLPMYPDMSEEIQGYIIESVKKALV